MFEDLNDIFDIVFPAQGLPIPISQIIGQNLNLKNCFHLSEPIGGSSPKISVVAKVLGLDVESSRSISLSCPAQGFPVPSFR